MMLLPSLPLSHLFLSRFILVSSFLLVLHKITPNLVFLPLVVTKPVVVLLAGALIGISGVACHPQTADELDDPPLNLLPLNGVRV